MNGTLIKAAIAAGPVSLLLFYSVLAFHRNKTLGAILQLVGAVSLAVVILSHVCVRCNYFRQWGGERSTAPAITSIYRAPLWDSPGFRWDICFRGLRESGVKSHCFARHTGESPRENRLD